MGKFGRQGARSIRIDLAFSSGWRKLLGAFAVILLLLGLPTLVGGHESDPLHQTPRNILFSSLSVKDGLAQANVYAITQDHLGFIWFATQEGLSRYNGYRFDNFYHNADDPGSLSHEWIWCIVEDRNGVLWIGSDGGGLSRYDRGSDSFIHYTHNPADSTSLSSDRVRVVVETGDGFLWIGTDGGGLNRLDPLSGNFIQYRHDPNNSEGLPNDKVLSIMEDRNGFLWIGTDGGGLARLDPDAGTFTVYRHDPAHENSLSSDRVRVIYEDSKGQIWVGTEGGGLNLMNPKHGTFQRFQHDINDPKSLSNDNVRSIVQDSYDTLWVGTSGGLNQWVSSDQNFLRYRSDPANPASLIDDRVKTLMQDRGDVLWIGTANGISRWNYVSDAFTYYGKTNDNDSYLASSMVTAIDQSKDGQLWIGTYGGGVSRIDPSQGVATHFRHDPARYDSLSSDEVMSILIDRDKQVWVGTRKDGLNRLNPETGSVDRFRHDANDPHSLPGNGITRIYGDMDGTLWIATYGGGLGRLSPGSERFEVFRHEPENPDSLSSNRVLTIYRDTAGSLWIGTEDGGLNEMDESNRSFVHYRHDAKNVRSLSSDAVWEILEGNDGSLWLGTNGGGLNRWLPEDRRLRRNRFVKYGKQEGLVSNTVQAILKEQGGALWLSSNRGLTRLDPATGNKRHFDNNNALMSNDFITGVKLHGHDGRLMFGGTEGFVSFHPDRIFTNHHIPPVVVTASTRLQPPVMSSSVEGRTPRLILDHKDYSITFEFAALDYTSPDKNQYRYRLHGFDREWINSQQYRRASYTNLPADNYQFQVQAANNDGIWNEVGASIDLRVLPPFWRSAWAYTLYVFAALGIFILILYILSKKSQWEAQQRKHLEEQVQERTLELSDRNVQLEQLNLKLKEASLTDSLTGLKNRRFLYEHIDTEIAWIDRRATEIECGCGDTEVFSESDLDEISLFFMMIDLDGFKRINDNHGHNAGDRALLQVRDILIRCCRGSDIVIRWGGDEFLIIGRSIGRKATERLAERLRSELANHSYTLGRNETGRLSGSIGFALYPFVASVPNMLHWETVAGIADQAAYLAKQNQRDAWVGIYSQATKSNAHNLLNIREALPILAQRGLVEINTSIPDELALFSTQHRSAV